MPELPEVETIRRTLAGKAAGRSIQKVEMLLERLIKWPAAPKFQAMVSGRRIEGLERRGKYLLLRLADGLVVVIHLRMTGRLFYAKQDAALDPYSRILFYLDDGAMLVYADTRTLGTLYAVPAGELWRIAGLASLGPEPLTEGFTCDYLARLLHKGRGQVKPLLLNQRYVGGLGNIYVDESLAVAGIHPGRIACTLTDAEAKRLHRAVNQVIADGIRDGGTSFRDYRDGDGNKGGHQSRLRVYGRRGRPCPVCGAAIVRTEIGGRGTHFCPHCQPKEGR